MVQQVIILAAGKAMRMNGVLKQLLPVDGTTIIDRTVAQVRKRGLEPLIVAKAPEILARSMMGIDPIDNRTTCDSLLSTRDYWRDQTAVLLGDVYYDPVTLEQILDYRGDIRVYGCTAEIYAVSFAKSVHDTVAVSLKAASQYRFGKLRYFYKHYCGLDMDCDERVGHAPDPVVFCYVNDGTTQDVDTEREYLDLRDRTIYRKWART